jgi:hypothetical protein
MRAREAKGLKDDEVGFSVPERINGMLPHLSLIDEKFRGSSEDSARSPRDGSAVSFSEGAARREKIEKRYLHARCT